MTRDKYFHKNYAVELLSISKGDLASAEVLASQMSKGRRENICFTAQQAFEKAIKAVLCARGKPIPLTHTIELLLDRLGSADQPPGSNALIELTDFATIRRYEEGHEIITTEDVDAILKVARETIEWAQGIIDLEIK